MDKRINRGALRGRLLVTTGLTVLMMGSGILFFGTQPARALNLYDGSQAGNNLEINLTTTLSYTGALRVNGVSSTLKTADGDSNFAHGIVTDLFSAVPVLDIRDGDFGAHLSGQLYLNTPYLGTNENDLTHNGVAWGSALYVAKQTDFTSATRNVDGENAQLLDAFIFGQHRFSGDQTLQVKLGRSVLFWGQSLFFPTDGISGGQAPIDVVSAQNLINPEAQQVFMPVGQVIVTYQPVSGTTIQGYYQFEWEHDDFQGEGAYFDQSNALDKGASLLDFGAAAGYAGLLRVKDIDPEHQNGQFGLSLQQEVGMWDIGVFGERFDAKGPELGAAAELGGPINPAGLNPYLGTLVHGYPIAGNYVLAYPRDIWLQGASFSTNVGPANVAGEFSVREHQPLVANGAYTFLPGQNTNNNPGYPVGDTWDAQLSEIYVTPAVPLDPGGVTIESEIILNHLIHVAQNRHQLNIDGQGTAGAFDLGIVPTYNEVLPNLQVTVPVSITYNYLGRSYVDSTLYHGTGTFDAGITATYESNWIASLSYQDYLGKPDPVNNALADRGFVSLNLQHTF